MTEATIYDFKVTTIEGKEISLKEYSGKVLLIVNTASKCGFTSQYEGLEKLYQEYKDKGLTILGFPCNQFGGQEPGSEKEIKTFCLKNYGVSFPLFAKINVNGKESHPLYTYLKEELPGTLGKMIKWNFTKFLIDRKGNPIKRFAPQSSPESLIPDLKKLI
ncbi:MAG: glutathione peroxidase [Pseudomonadota bacterium]